MQFIPDDVLPALRGAVLPAGKRVRWAEGLPLSIPDLDDGEWRRLIGEAVHRRVFGPVAVSGLSSKSLRRWVGAAGSSSSGSFATDRCDGCPAVVDSGTWSFTVTPRSA
jgi:hypothetical protein